MHILTIIIHRKGAQKILFGHHFSLPKMLKTTGIVHQNNSCKLIDNDKSTKTA